ncbi:MAG TPA: hypothetical protein PLI65_02550 [Bacteroidales bacterium]|nr:hypothetical protein [Bacteroidales bacterium]
MKDYPGIVIFNTAGLIPEQVSRKPEPVETLKNTEKQLQVISLPEPEWQ